MAKYPSVFHLVADVFTQKGVTAVLIGGFAVNHYKVTRQTADVDFLVTKDDFERIAGLLEREGFKKDYAQEVFARLTGSGQYLLDIDFMFVDKDTLDKIMKDAERVSIAGNDFIVPSVYHLIALKLHAIKYNPKIREYKDLADIIELVRANKLAVGDDEFKQLCLKYGTQDLYDKIIRGV